MSKNTKAGMERNKDKVAELVANGTQPLPEVLAPLVGVHERTIRNYLKEMELEPHNSELRQRGALAILGMIADKLDELENDHLIRTDVVQGVAPPRRDLLPSGGAERREALGECELECAGRRHKGILPRVRTADHEAQA